MNETTPTPPPVPDDNPPDEQPTTVLGEQPAANPVAPDQPTQVLGTDPTQVGSAYAGATAGAYPRARARTQQAWQLRRRYPGRLPAARVLSPPGGYQTARRLPAAGCLPAAQAPTRLPGATYPPVRPAQR